MCIPTDVSITASDASHLEGWFSPPARTNGDAVILSHGEGDNRQGTMGSAEPFLSNRFAGFVSDSRAHAESGSGFPTYGLRESDGTHGWFDWWVMPHHPNCVFGMGESIGAAIILRTVKTPPFCAAAAEPLVRHLPRGPGV